MQTQMKPLMRRVLHSKSRFLERITKAVKQDIKKPLNRKSDLKVFCYILCASKKFLYIFL